MSEGPPSRSTSHAVERLLSAVARRCRYTFPGLLVGLVFACLSFTPSLLPRPTLFQGLISGIDAAIGYGLGVLGAWIWREFADRPPRPASRRSWTVLGVVAGVTLATSMLLGIRWQRHGHNYTGEHVYGWAAILQPDGWNAERADVLRDLIRSGELDQPFSG